MFLSWGLGSPSKVGREHLPIEALIKISVYQKGHLPKGGFIPKGEFILKKGWGTFFADGELFVYINCRSSLIRPIYQGRSVDVVFVCRADVYIYMQSQICFYFVSTAKAAFILERTCLFLLPENRAHSFQGKAY